MTDRHPDDLYDALRDRLADYGQEPPAPLWANIRAQLPPPVARPRLRRRRRWSPVLLLVLLVATTGSTYWFWRHAAATGPLAHRTPAPSVPGIEHRLGKEEDGATTTISPDAARTGGLQTSASSTSTRRTAAARAPGFGADRAGDEPGGSRGTRPVRNSAAENAAFVRQTSVERRVRHRIARSTLIGSAASTGAPATRPAAPSLDVVAKNTLGTGTTGGIVISNEASETTAVQPPTRTAPTSLATNNPLPAATNFSVTAAAETATVATGRVAASPVALQLWAVPGPFVRTQPDSFYLPKRLARHWALLVLAGPARTHRRLGSSTPDEMLAPTSSAGVGLPTTRPDSSSTTRRLAQQERQSTGAGVQVQASRVLNGRWTISAGLGYQEYASTVATTETSADRFMVASTSTITHRDTYHFLTVPVQAHYALGQVGKRLRYGVVAGVEAAIYLFGSNLQLNGSVRDWNASTSPYRLLNLALSTGLDVRYRLAPRLEVVAQPTATYFLNPLARPASGLPPRYLWGGSALLGLSYHLR